uniref:Putative secreted protein n=1 Tax=Ixodes ricinus TaxID=34613 RepID=A0A6B0V5M4_IXORI
MVRQNLPGGVALSAVVTHVLPSVLGCVPPEQAVRPKGLAAQRARVVYRLHHPQAGVVLQVLLAGKHPATLGTGELPGMLADVAEEVERLVEALAAQVTAEASRPLGTVQPCLLHAPVKLLNHLVLILIIFGCLNRRSVDAFRVLKFLSGTWRQWSSGTMVLLPLFRVVGDLACLTRKGCEHLDCDVEFFRNNRSESVVFRNFDAAGFCQLLLNRIGRLWVMTGRRYHVTTLVVVLKVRIAFAFVV